MRHKFRTVFVASASLRRLVPSFLMEGPWARGRTVHAPLQRRGGRSRSRPSKVKLGRNAAEGEGLRMRRGLRNYIHVVSPRSRCPRDAWDWPRVSYKIRKPRGEKERERRGRWRERNRIMLPRFIPTWTKERWNSVKVEVQLKVSINGYFKLVLYEIFIFEFRIGYKFFSWPRLQECNIMYIYISCDSNEKLSANSKFKSVYFTSWVSSDDY